MNSVSHKISLDIHKTGTQVFLPMMRGDSKRSIVISLTEGRVPYDIHGVSLAKFSCVKTSGNFFDDSCKLDYKDNTIVYNVDPQVLACVGAVNCQITLTGQDGGILSTPTFGILVGDTLYSEKPIVEDSEEFNFLTRYIADVQKNLGDINIRELSPAIVGNASGSTIQIDDSASLPLRKLSIYGKSVQNGTPTPSFPIDIVSVGENGVVLSNVFGKSVTGLTEKKSFSSNGITFTINDDGSVTANGTATDVANLNVAEYNNWYLPKGKYKFSIGITSNSLVLIVGAKGGNVPYAYGKNEIEFECTKSGKENGNCVIQIQAGVTVSNITFYPMIRLHSVIDGSFEKHKSPKSLSVSTSNGLKGIPVTDPALATYTDDNGQMWYADEVDLDRGVYIKRTFAYTCTGNETWKVSDNQYMTSATRYDGVVSCDFGGAGDTQVVCSHFAYNGINVPGTWVNNTPGNTLSLRVYVHNDVIASLDKLVEFIKEQYNSGTPITYVGKLASPIETPLSDDEIAQYNALKMNYPNTTILNDEDAYMNVEYVVDTKSYIDKASGSSSYISYVDLPSSKWQGSQSPYSQVVDIAGVTENSRVDLNPSIEQLAVFHNKDIAFVTENEDGVVTVYCIGQKPVADYTIQATITEVIANG